MRLSQQTHQRWNNVDVWLKMKVEPTYIYQHCFNIDKTTLIEWRRFNVDEPTLFQRWNLVENESWANVCLSTLFQRWQDNVETTLIELRWFNVDDPMLFQRWYYVEKESWVNACSLVLRKQHWNILVNISCTEVH